MKFVLKTLVIALIVSCSASSIAGEFFLKGGQLSGDHLYTS